MYLEGDEQYNFVTGIANFDLNMQVRQQYPILLKILEGSLNSNGILGKPIRSDFHLYANLPLSHFESHYQSLRIWGTN